MHQTKLANACNKVCARLNSLNSPDSALLLSSQCGAQEVSGERLGKECANGHSKAYYGFIKLAERAALLGHEGCVFWNVWP